MDELIKTRLELTKKDTRLMDRNYVYGHGNVLIS